MIESSIRMNNLESDDILFMLDTSGTNTFHHEKINISTNFTYKLQFFIQFILFHEDVREIYLFSSTYKLEQIGLVFLCSIIILYLSGQLFTIFLPSTSSGSLALAVAITIVISVTVAVSLAVAVSVAVVVVVVSVAVE